MINLVTPTLTITANRKIRRTSKITLDGPSGMSIMTVNILFSVLQIQGYRKIPMKMNPRGGGARGPPAAHGLLGIGCESSHEPVSLDGSPSDCYGE